MHRIPTQPGNWSASPSDIQQTPAPMVFLTAADTDIQTLAQAVTQLPANFPALRVCNWLKLSTPYSIDRYIEQTLSHANVIILRLLGGLDYWAYGVERLRELNAQVWVMPGDDQMDLSIFEQSHVPLHAVQYLHQYLRFGGVVNYRHALEFVASYSLNWPGYPPPPQPIPEWGTYDWGGKCLETAPGVGILFYRAHVLAGNTAVIDEFCRALQARNLQPFPYYIHTLTHPETRLAVERYYQEHPTQVLCVTTGFSVAQWRSEIPELELWQNLDVPVLQIILSTDEREIWHKEMRGLSPKDLAMQVALPEVDGRIITRAISFKTATQRHPDLETPIYSYQPVPDRVNFVADLAQAWVRLRTTPIPEQNIAIIFANYPTDDGRIANGVGLDTPASCIQVWQALHQAGYTVPPPLKNGDELMQRLTRLRTNDPESHSRNFEEFVPLSKYQHWLTTIPQSEAIIQRWGSPETIAEQGKIPIYGQRWGNLFIGIQPSRGYEQDPSLNYHSPDLEPTHHYLAFYYWLRYEFQAHAVIHLGKHGTLEWLPGKSVALSATCYPEIALGALPHFYPFIVNDPGEGTQAKRRAQAVILDHLTPPLTRAELYGPLLELETLVDEYYQAQALDPERLPWIGRRLEALLKKHHLLEELPILQEKMTHEIIEVIDNLDTYLCELKEAQIRGGLHIFGICPEGELLRDLLIAISRYPGANRLGLTQAIAQDWGWDFDPLDVSQVGEL
ncbi:cobaltochelatase subunit CobN [Synechococcus sp. C9]|uniref:cobaltochelatase subunit CobN n=1 Tax=Synechococcus sp. C9 TaxID=102119 RepID=UPI001FF2CA6C|nr:cobaltochelatase subunit CobN [Synechococcus sp. C9]